MEEEEQKSLLRKMMWRFHPDKFLPRMSLRLEAIQSTDEYNRIVSHLNRLFQLARRNLRLLQLGDGESFE